MERILPAYPLFVKDPNFSIWAVTECLNEADVESWWGAKKPIYGFLKTKEKTYCFMGKAESFSYLGVEKAEQTRLSVSAFSTDYVFKIGDGELKLRFVSPLPLNNPSLLAMPATYMEYEISGIEDGEVALFVHSKISYNEVDGKEQDCRGAVVPMAEMEAAFVGLRRQLLLSNNNDSFGADWGYWYLAGERAYVLDERDLTAYLTTGNTDFAFKQGIKYIGAIGRKTKGAITLAYDDIVAIDYFGDLRKGYYLQDHPLFEALIYVNKNREKINEELSAFDDDLRRRAEKYGKEYYTVLLASLRQAISMHKLIKDKNGNLLFLSKESGSNGCIATVDISYPSMPLFLLYDTEYVKGMMRPVLEFAKMPVWKFDFAPHDAGTYPSCRGQVYGFYWKKPSKYHGNLFYLGFRNYERQNHAPLYALPQESDIYNFGTQMPVEECANMLIMFLACYRFDGDIDFFKKERGLCEKWIEYLVRYGLKPEDQLCTDDFAGRLKNNLNLAIKATVGIAAYAELIAVCGEKESAKKYREIAQAFAGEIISFGEKFSHLPLTWDSDESTFSLKYNFAFDKILNLGLFPQSLFERETDYYLEKLNVYGVSLDSRSDYTKSDWLMWAAALTDVSEKCRKFIVALDAFLKESPDRIPFGDLYDTKSGNYRDFRARSVQGGCFILLLKEN